MSSVLTCSQISHVCRDEIFRCENACVLDVLFCLICFTFQNVKTQKHSISTVSMFSVIMLYSLCLCKIGNLDIIVIKISFTYLCYNLFDLLFVYFCSFSFRIVNKMIDFCHEKAYVKLQAQSCNIAKDVRENVTKCFLKTTEILLNDDGHVATSEL